MDDEFHPNGRSPLSLMSDEQEDLARVVEKGRVAGWLGAKEQLIAERNGALVVVRLHGGKRSVEHSYRYNDRWLVELIRDLAAGIYARRAGNGKRGP